MILKSGYMLHTTSYHSSFLIKIVIGCDDMHCIPVIPLQLPQLIQIIYKRRGNRIERFQLRELFNDPF